LAAEQPGGLNRVDGADRTQHTKGMTSRVKHALFCVSLAALLPVWPVFGEEPATTEVASQFSSNAMDLCGKWSIRSERSTSERTFEFFPDGQVTEISTYKSTREETTQTYQKLWKIQGDKIFISPKGTDGGSNQSIFIDLPFDTSKLQITEVWTSSSSTRQAKMFAERLEAPKPSSGLAVPAATPPPPSALLTKLGISVIPSTKNSTQDYYKIQRISLNITLKNSCLRESTGLMNVSYWILGKNVSDSKQFAVFSKGQFDCSLGSNISDRELKRSTDTYLNKYYSFSSSRGFEYAGWIVAVSDPAGNIAAIKSNKPEWERQGDKLPGLEVFKVYDLPLNEVEGSYVPRYY